MQQPASAEHWAYAGLEPGVSSAGEGFKEATACLSQQHSKGWACSQSSHPPHNAEVPRVPMKRLRHREATCYTVRAGKWPSQDWNQVSDS